MQSSGNIHVFVDHSACAGAVVNSNLVSKLLKIILNVTDLSMKFIPRLNVQVGIAG